ncbi:MAG: HAD-IC family P-type ATPase, partial [Parcubacteria group bacterium]|nr:HAD-IC family P-type ATPase [Parcubacteria group bacterium]
MQKKQRKIDGVKKSAGGHREWHQLTLSETAKKLGVGRAGLSQKQVDERLQKHGPNALPQGERDGAALLLLRQFKNSLTYILLIASAISFWLGDFIDGYVILAAVAFNVVVGFIQEYKAENALAALKKIITQNAWVIREGAEREVPASTLVPGDILLLSPGLKIPADGRLFEAEHLKISEAALTGESEPCAKIAAALEGELTLADQHNMAWSGTVVAEGRGKCFVTATGTHTEIGRIARLVKETKEPRTPLQAKLDRFSQVLALGVLALAALVVLVGILLGQSFTEMFVTGVAVAVAAIPESAVIVVTITLVVGMRRILAKGSLVRKLVAAETLGSTSVICVDKTGTVTLGEMRVVRLLTATHDIDTIANGRNVREIQQGQWELRWLHKIGINCNNAVMGEAAMGSPTEKALLLSGIESGFDERDAGADRPRLDEIPFDSAKKFMATLHAWTKKQHAVYLKGAPEKILAASSTYQVGRSIRAMDAQKRKEFLARYEKLSKEGLRVLAAAYKPVPALCESFAEIPDYNEGAVFVGFWGLKDPLRPEASETLELAKAAGMRTIMITGDNRHTAFAIAHELGLAPKKDGIIDGAELSGLSDSELARAVKKVTVFSRATPEDKLRIVRALQANGEVVAMTGDGVNDAPALRLSDIGVAVGSGTDVARETADLVLLDNKFSTIVAAVREGRVIFDNIRKVMLYLLANSFTEMAVVVVGLLLGWPLPILAAQILWINLVTDGLPDLALTQEPEEEGVMDEPPQERHMPILDYERKFLIVFISAITSAVTLGLFYLIWKTEGDLDRARTVAFTAIGVESLLYVFSVRSIRRSIFETKLFANRWLLAAVAGGFVIQIVGVYAPFFQTFLRTVPLSLADWLLILFACLWVIGAIEI